MADAIFVRSVSLRLYEAVVIKHMLTHWKVTGQTSPALAAAPLLCVLLLFHAEALRLALHVITHIWRPLFWDVPLHTLILQASTRGVAPAQLSRPTPV
jgi:hypothetical protein